MGTITTGAAPGTVAFRFAQNTVDATNGTTMKASSSLIAYRVRGADLAEVYYSKDGSITPGTVVSLDSTISAGVGKSAKAYDRNVIGIVTTKPGLVLGDSTAITSDFPVMVALSGRVPVKVSTENGQINPGDLLTSSSIPGVAMKATKAGQTIGQAMTAYSGTEIGTVVAFIKTDVSNGTKAKDIISLYTGVPSQVSNEEVGRNLLAQFVENKTALITSEDISEITTDRINSGLEVVTPRVITSELYTDTIRSASSTDISVLLADQGKFKVTNASGSEVFSINSLGEMSVKSITVGTSTVQNCAYEESGSLALKTCVADENLTSNVNDLSSVLEKYTALRVVNYNWNTVANIVYAKDTSLINKGYIAQNIETVFPELVTTNSLGYKEINYQGLSIYTTQAVKELATKVASLFNGVADIVINSMTTNKVKTKELCIDDVCVTKEQLLQMLQNSANNQSSSTQSSPATTTVEDVIEPPLDTNTGTSTVTDNPVSSSTDLLPVPEVTASTTTPTTDTPSLDSATSTPNPVEPVLETSTDTAIPAPPAVESTPAGPVVSETNDNQAPAPDPTPIPPPEQVPQVQ
jgi:hypothetical protein